MTSDAPSRTRHTWKSVPARVALLFAFLAAVNPLIRDVDIPGVLGWVVGFGYLALVGVVPMVAGGILCDLYDRWRDRRRPNAVS